MATNNAMFLEGHSITRHPMFIGINFVFWRDRMKIFVQSIDIDLWYIICEGPLEANVIDVNTHRLRPKTRYELNAKDKVNLSLNAKAINILYNILDADEFSKVKGCKSAKEIWDKLKEIREGNEDIRE
ncbi:hypothetical protein ACH5RR_033674 [Cinchona calisaya]|uniref:Uncharacterized protein n=1 Tax=Cinchona calisaya TaxID=153742 RepID=A0ABD2Y8M6_9GENT